MNAVPLAVKSDIRPIEFVLAVVGGGVGSALLSALQPNPWISVSFALVVMGTVATLRFRIASKHKDSKSLEAFAEDVYLLGYLLTLAAFVGLAPRLMSEEANLFQIAGVKLLTTIFGLGVMMVFRQLANRWAEEKEPAEADRFAAQEQQFRSAVGRLNDSAEELTAKMEEVALRFDPDLLGPVAEWSNRAANAFSEATRAFEAVPGATAPSIRSLHELCEDVNRVKAAVADLANLLTVQVGAASVDLGKNLGEVGIAARQLGASVAGLQPAAEASRLALDNLGNQARNDVDRLGDMNLALGKIASELTKVEDSLRKLGSESPADVTAPLNQLVHALSMASDRTDSHSTRIDQLSKDLHGSVIASREVGNRLASELSAPMSAHTVALGQVNDQLHGTVRQIERLAHQFEGFMPMQLEFARQLASELGALRQEMGGTNRQLQLLIEKMDRPPISTEVLSKQVENQIQGDQK